MNVNEYLDGFEGSIVVLSVGNEVFPAWSKRRNEFLYDGELRGKNVREMLPDELVIEFDERSAAENVPRELVRSHAFNAVLDLCKAFDAWGKGYHVTDHGGVSPHFRTRIIGLTDEEPRLRCKYKEEFANALLENTGFRSKLVKLDRSLLRSKSKLLPLEDAPHWKTKYDGAKERVIKESQNPYSRVRRERLDELRPVSASSKAVLHRPPAGPFFSSIHGQRLTEFMTRWYAKGRRHYLTTAVGSMLAVKGVPYVEAESAFFNALLYVQSPRYEKEDFADFRYGYESGLRGMGPSGMLKLATHDDDEAKSAYIELMKSVEESI